MSARSNNPLCLFTNPGSQRPENLAVHLTLAIGAPETEALVAWIGMAGALYLAHFNSANKEKMFKTIEIDP